MTLLCVFFCCKNINALTSVSVTKLHFVDNSVKSQKMACSKNRVETGLPDRAEILPKGGEETESPAIIPILLWVLDSYALL
jgi:hypothetical protein